MNLVLLYHVITNSGELDLTCLLIFLLCLF